MQLTERWASCPRAGQSADVARWAGGLDAGEGSENGSKLIKGNAKTGGGDGGPETLHRPISAFDAAVILFDRVVQVSTGPVVDSCSQLGFDRAGVAIMPIGRDRDGVTPVTALAGRKNAIAAAMSRFALNMASTRILPAGGGAWRSMSASAALPTAWANPGLITHSVSRTKSTSSVEKS